MSYRQRYNTSLTVHGTVNASYPASQNGGSHSISYTHTEPITVDIDVDTNPFDYSIDDCDKRLDVLKGAVVGMNAAQVASITSSARKVAKHVTDGFFGLVSSEISQQIADLMNKVSSKFALMIEQKKASENILNLMQQDYARLAGHYIELFHNLDDELHRRITALDNYSFNLSIEVMHKLLFQNSLSQASSYAIESEELGATQSLMAASVIRSKVNGFIHTAHKYILDHSILAKGMADILDDVRIIQATNEHVPVMIIESRLLKTKDNEVRYIVPDDTPKSMRSSIEKSIKDKSKSLKWVQENNFDRKIVEQEFYKLINDTFSNKSGEACMRQRDLMIKLWQKSPAACLSKSNKGA